MNNNTIPELNRDESAILVENPVCPVFIVEIRFLLPPKLDLRRNLIDINYGTSTFIGNGRICNFECYNMGTCSQFGFIVGNRIGK